MSHAVSAPKARHRGTVAAGLLALALAAASALASPAARAEAADFGSTPVTAVTMTPTTLGDTGTGRIDFTWVAPAGAAAGDTFRVTLPDELEPASTRDIELIDADSGEVAVRGVWSGKTATFTFQSYISAHTGVHGTGYFYVKWDHDVITDAAGTFTGLQIGGFTLPTITKGAAGPIVQTRAADKGGGWNDATQTKFTWFLVMPGSTASALAGPVVLTDVAPPDPGFTYDCASFQLRRDLGGYPSPTNQTAFTAPASGADVTAFTCSGSQFTLTFSSIPAGSFFTLIAPVTITDTTRTSFDNTATFDWPALNGSPNIQPAELRRDDAGGTVEADAPAEGTVCVGDYVWEDLDEDGVQDAGEPGIPGVVVRLLKVSADGSATVVTSGGSALTATTDGSGLYRFCGLPVLQRGEKYRTAIALDQAALKPFTVTKSGRGTDATDSSAAEGFADTVVDLTVAGSSDLTLDYGFVRVPQLAESGADGSTAPVAAWGLLTLLAGVALVARRARRA